MKRRSRSPFSTRSRSFSRGQHPAGVRALRISLALLATLFVAGFALFSLRFPVSARLARLLQAVPEAGRPFAEQAPLAEDSQQNLRALLADVPEGTAPASTPLSTFGVTLTTTLGPDARPREAQNLLSRARSPLSATRVAGEDRLIALSHSLDPLTHASFSRRVIAILPGEKLRLEFPVRRNDSAGRVEARVRLLAATADRLDTPAKGTLVGPSGEAETFEISPRGEASWLAMDARTGGHVEIDWPAAAPGFLSIEGWRGGVFERSSEDATEVRRKSARGLLVVAIDGLARTNDDTGKNANEMEEPGALLPRTSKALNALYGQGNVASFTRVMPNSTDADDALFTLLTGRVSRTSVGPGSQEADLFSEAARSGLPSVFARMEPASDSPLTPLQGVGDPTAFLHLPRRSEIARAMTYALSAGRFETPGLRLLSVRFPAERLFPTWTTALRGDALQVPALMLSGAGRYLGVEPPASLAQREKRRQLDDALAAFLETPGLTSTQDVAIIVLRGGDAKDGEDPRPPEAGFAWIASQTFASDAPKSGALVSLRALNGPLARSLGRQSRNAAGVSDATAPTGSSLATLTQALTREEKHTVTTTDQGVWHLFPYGNVLIPTRGAAPLDNAERQTRYVWDVPLSRTRETQRALSGSGLGAGFGANGSSEVNGAAGGGQKEQALHVFFPPTGAKERVAASLAWRLDPRACASEQSDPNEGAAARGVVDRDEKTGRRLWLTGVADAKRGLHIVCAFDGGPRQASPVEMHFERGSKSLALSSVGLGEFALPLPQFEDGVQLAQARFDEIAPLLSAQFAPSWRELEGYKVLIWEDPNPTLAFEGLTPMELQRKDRESEEAPAGSSAPGGLLVPRGPESGPAAAAGDATLPAAGESRAQRRSEDKP